MTMETITPALTSPKPLHQLNETDIYDRELLAVILALDEWQQYLRGTTHPVTVITDHKNLSYIKDPRKLFH